MTRGIKSQTAFVAGEISPRLYGRTDLAKYHLGLQRVKNFFVGYRGGLVSRAGTEFVGELSTVGNADPGYDRLFRFRLAGDDVLLVAGDEEMRPVQNGAFAFVASAAVTGMTTGAGKLVLTMASTAIYQLGDIVYVKPGEAGDYSEFESRFFIVTAITPTVLTLGNCHWNGPAENVTIASSGATYPTFTRAYRVTAPWPREEIGNLRLEQRYDEAVMVNGIEVPYRLNYTNLLNWSLGAISFGSASAPAGLTLTKSGAGSAGAAFTVTAVVGGKETIGATYAIESTMVNYSTTAGEMLVTWSAVTDAEYYNVYRSLIIATGANVTTDLEVGYIGRSVGERFVDTNIVADFTKSPPIGFNPFSDSNNQPAAFKYFQTRGVYAGFSLEPMTLYGSKPGDLDNFDVSNALNAGDSYSYTVDSPEVSPLKHLMTLRRGLLLFSGEQVSLLTSGEATGVTPLNAVLEPQAYIGSADTPPIAIAQDIVFAQENSTSVQAMMFTEYQDTFQLVDLSILSDHFFTDAVEIKRMVWQQEPDRLLWVLLENGRLLSCTYARTEEVFGWAEHETDGIVRDIEVVREGNVDVLYLMVERKTNGYWRMFLERMRQRTAPIHDMWALDSALEVALTAGTIEFEADATSGTGVELYGNGAAFSGISVGDRLYFGGGVAEVTALTFTSQITVDYIAPLKREAQVRYDDWSWGTPVSTVSGLWHLEGKTVTALVDGVEYSGLTVSGASVTLPTSGVRVIVGLPYVCDAQSLPLRPEQQEDAAKLSYERAVRAAVRISETRGLEVGDSFDSLSEVIGTTEESLNSPYAPFSGETIELLEGRYEKEATICARQASPLWATILNWTVELDGEE